jgi:undecaprenyl-diphosphatase
MERVLPLVHRYDNTVGRYFKKLPKKLHAVMIFFSFLGQPVFTVGAIFAVLFWAYDTGTHRALVAGLTAMVGVLVSLLIKFVTERARPRSRYVENMWFHTYSFPSGHASGSTIGFGILALTLIQYTSLSLVLVLSTWLITCFLIGISRIYLEAHYPSDVTAGWLLGGVTIMACRLILTHQIA